MSEAADVVRDGRILALRPAASNAWATALRQLPSQFALSGAALHMVDHKLQRCGLA